MNKARKTEECQVLNASFDPLLHGGAATVAGMDVNLPPHTTRTHQNSECHVRTTSFVRWPPTEAMASNHEM